MKQNPCKSCESSFEYGGLVLPKPCEKCHECEERIEHLRFIRGYSLGQTITDISELLNQKVVFCHNNLKDIMDIETMTIRTALIFLKTGEFRKAIKKESEAKCSDETGSGTD